LTQPKRKGLAASVYGDAHHADGGSGGDAGGCENGGPVQPTTDLAAKLSSSSSPLVADNGDDEKAEDRKDVETPSYPPLTVLSPRFLAACKQMKELRTSFILEMYEDLEGRAHVVFENLGAAMWAGENVGREFGYGMGVRVGFGGEGGVVGGSEDGGVGGGGGVVG